MPEIYAGDLRDILTPRIIGVSIIWKYCVQFNSFVVYNENGPTNAEWWVPWWQWGFGIMTSLASKIAIIKEFTTVHFEDL